MERDNNLTKVPLSIEVIAFSKEMISFADPAIVQAHVAQNVILKLTSEVDYDHIELFFASSWDDVEPYRSILPVQFQRDILERLRSGFNLCVGYVLPYYKTNLN